MALKLNLSRALSLTNLVEINQADKVRSKEIAKIIQANIDDLNPKIILDLLALITLLEQRRADLEAEADAHEAAELTGALNQDNVRGLQEDNRRHHGH